MVGTPEISAILTNQIRAPQILYTIQRNANSLEWSCLMPISKRLTCRLQSSKFITRTCKKKNSPPPRLQIGQIFPNCSPPVSLYCCSGTSSPVLAKVSAASFSVWRSAAHPLHHVWAAPVHQRHCTCLSVIGTSLWEELRLVLHGGAG